VGSTFTNQRSWLLVVCLFFVSRATAAPQDAPEATFRTSAAEVSVTFSATDQNNHGVTTLHENDFAVVDRDFIVRTFRSFSHAEYTRLDVALVVDTSGSVTDRYRQELVSVAQLLSEAHGVPEQNPSMVSFAGNQPSLVCSRDCASHAVDELLPRPGGLTPLFDSIVFASHLLQQRGDPHARKVLILLTDGDDTISQHSFADAMVAALANQVHIYTISMDPREGTGAARLRALASATGAQAFTLQEGTNALVDAVFEDFHSTYTVTYGVSTRRPGFHAVRIFPTHNLNLHFHSPNGYSYFAETR
jgi:VWFA-related protein